MKVSSFKQSGIGGHEIARDQPHKVARNNLAPQYLYPLAITQRNRCRSNLFAKPLSSALRTKCLDEVERAAYQHHNGYDSCVENFAEKGRDNTGDEQDDGERVGEQKQNLDNGSSGSRRGQFVR